MNPLSFVFDLEVRDVAEYLKAMFFKGNKMIAGPCIIMVSGTGYVGKFFDGSIDWIESCYK